MVMTELGTEMAEMPLQWLKAPSLMMVTEGGRETAVRPVQEWKALLPMEVTRYCDVP